jgi:hypothetical protein
MKETYAGTGLIRGVMEREFPIPFPWILWVQSHYLSFSLLCFLIHEVKFDKVTSEILPYL